MAAVKTSRTDPIRVDWILEGLPGQIGLTFAPGKHGDGKVAGVRWERDLAADLDRLRDHFGMGLQLCLLEDHELIALGIPTLVDAAEARGVTVRRLPIPDGGVLPTVAPVQAVVRELLAAARAGTNVVIHCMGGLGRAGTIGGCALVASGLTAEQALARLRERRGARCPETEAQRAFIRAFRAG